MERGPNGVVLSLKEWRRMVQLIEGEYANTEAQILEWVNDDDSPTWAGDEWSKVEPL